MRHGRGDHDIRHSPITGRNITVDGEIRIRHVANGILKQAGIDYHF
ncbi:MAG: type II toxin-antitoxin system HicA family toxin [Treponema sp.]|nr:type II toxin-antitoxin system HicA family toxin [Treponema sp.]